MLYNLNLRVAENAYKKMRYTYKNFRKKNIVVPEDATEVDVCCSPITSIDLSNCEKLERLDCSETRITSLDVSNCKKLEYLNCSNTYIKSLDVSQCKELGLLDCSDTRLASLDVSKCAELGLDAIFSEKNVEIKQKKTF